jgi:hypothetical protein
LADRIGLCGLEQRHGTPGALLESGAQILPQLEIKTMLDVLFIVVTVAFFAISLAYTAGCERL